MDASVHQSHQAALLTWAPMRRVERLSHLLQHIQDELLEDLADAHGHGLRVEALAEAGPHQVDQVPRRQAALPVQLQPVVGKLLLAPAAAHGLRQPPQEVLHLQRGVTVRKRTPRVKWRHVSERDLPSPPRPQWLTGTDPPTGSWRRTRLWRRRRRRWPDVWCRCFFCSTTSSTSCWTLGCRTPPVPEGPERLHSAAVQVSQQSVVFPKCQEGGGWSFSSVLFFSKSSSVPGVIFIQVRAYKWKAEGEKHFQMQSGELVSEDSDEPTDSFYCTDDCRTKNLTIQFNPEYLEKLSQCRIWGNFTAHPLHFI